ncbi:MAG: sigma-54 dependent transcriptional regulator [Planctomycetota bacterium]
MRKILMSWVGLTDLRAPKESDKVGLGPVAQALSQQSYDHVVLMTNYPESDTVPYVDWLRERYSGDLELAVESLSGPTAFGEIHEAVVQRCEAAQESTKSDVKFTFHLSPGTPAMAAVWILLGKTRFQAELIESSRDHGVRVVDVPFDISMDFIPELLRERDERLKELSHADSPESPEFADIIHRSRVMSRLVQRAGRVAIRNVPVLIEGESGTGKEMLARAIHKASPRSKGEFVSVNCGAIPSELVESELFGYVKGAFSGAAKQKKGYFEAAEGGTLFLDEIGELPALSQVKLLRVLDQNEVVRLGATKPTKIDVRIVAATNRTLTEEIASGRFREDLFYRLAVAIIKIPALRDRSGDLGLLLDHLMKKVNDEAKGEPGFVDKKLSAGARNLMMSHSWPGNVRELLNTLRRMAIWSDGATMTVEDARESLLPAIAASASDILGRSLGTDLDLDVVLGVVERHYIERAIEEAAGNKSNAAKLLGLSSYQTLSNRMKKHGIDS